MFGNLIRECGVLNSLSETAQKVKLVGRLFGLEGKDQGVWPIQAQVKRRQVRGAVRPQVAGQTFHDLLAEVGVCVVVGHVTASYPS